MDHAPAGGPAAAAVAVGAGSPWTALALPVAAVWSLIYLGLGVAWLLGAPGNPADPAVDSAPGLSPLTLWGARTGAALLTGLAAIGVLLSGAMAVHRRAPRRARGAGRLAALLAGALGLVLAVALPDFRLLAALAYSPILLVLTLTGNGPAGANAWPWPVLNMAVLTLAGLAWFAAAVEHHRRMTAGDPRAAWTSPAAASRWGRWATAVAVAVPLGYAATRYAWALGIPLGVSRQLLDDLGDSVYAGAGLATLAVVGAILTLGLVQHWGEVFPRWVPWLRGRRVPVGLAVVPAAIVSMAVASAGLMFVRFAITGQLGATFPGEDGDVAAWLPEMFWPLWAAALAAAAYAYWLRRTDPGDVGRHHDDG